MNHRQLGALLGMSAGCYTALAMTAAVSLGIERKTRLFIAHGYEDDMLASLAIACLPLGICIGWAIGAITPLIARCRRQTRVRVIVALSIIAVWSVSSYRALEPYAVAIAVLHAFAFARITEGDRYTIPCARMLDESRPSSDRESARWFEFRRRDCRARERVLRSLHVRLFAESLVAPLLIGGE